MQIINFRKAFIEVYCHFTKAIHNNIIISRNYKVIGLATSVLFYFRTIERF